MLQMALKEKVLVGEKNPQDYQKKEEKVKNRDERVLYWEFARQTSGGCRGVLEIVQEWFYKKKGTELILTAWEQALGANFVKHSIDMIRPLRHQYADFVVTPLKQYGILSVHEGSLPREKIGMEKWG